MSPLKKSGFIVAILFLMFFTACGGGGNNSNNNNQNGNTPTISISQSDVKAYVGDQKTIPVTARNTDFSVSVSPASGSGCDKSGNNVVCKPTVAGRYTVTVTATSDTSKRVTATVTVPELEIFDGDKQTVLADETKGMDIPFNAAGNWTATAAGDYGDVSSWLSLSTVSGVSNLADPTEDDSIFQLNDYGDYRIMAAVNVSGSSGYNTIRITLQPNNSMADRTATITITTSGGQIKATITQRYIKRDGTPLYPGEVLISISPLSASTTVGTTRTFTVTRVNTDDFTLSAPTAAGCVKSGVNAVVCTPTAAGTYTVTVTATADTTKSASATLELSVSISISPTSEIVPVGETRTFTVATQNTDFTLSVPTAAGCAKSGVNAVVCTPTAAGTYTIRVTATADTTKSASATFTVSPAFPTVTFNSNSGSSVPSVQIKYGEAIPAPAEPTRTDYSFDGWYSNSGLTTKVTFPYTVTNNVTLYAKWIRLYTVTFDSNYGSSVPLAQVRSGEQISIPTEPTRTGFDFDGWYSNSGLTTKATFPYTVTNNLTLYAKWIRKTYTVTFNSNGGSSVPSAQVQYDYTVAAPTSPTLTGYSFDGWYSDNNTFANKITFQYTVTGDITLHAKWIRLCTVTFNSNGGSSVPSAQVLPGTRISAPTEPTYAGYAFDGWYSDDGFTTKITFQYTVTGDITLYAKWTRLTTVTFNSSPGSSVPPVKARPGERISAPTAPTRTNYDFDGWYSDSELTAKVTFQYTVPERDVTLYAKWIRLTTITFNSNSGSSVPSVQVRPGTLLSKPADPTRTNYEFDGWYSNSGLTTSVTFPYTVPEGDVTLYAKWTRLYTVTFNSNGGSSISPVQVRTGTSLPKPTPDPTQIGYDFNGWYVNAGLTTQAVFPYSVSSDITLYAKWTLQDSFITISTADELNNVRTNLSGNYVLIANISLSSYANWVPIGTSTTPFTGIIIGNGYKITGLKIDRSTEDYIGLFGYIRSGSMVDIVLENVDIKGRSYVGAVAGYMQNGTISTISGSSITGLITSYVNSSYRQPYYSGGITGYMEGGTITGAYSAAVVTSSGASAYSSDYSYHSGGIAGYVNTGIITDSRSAGNVSSIFPYTAYSGGIAGYITSGGEINGSSSAGNVISNSSGYNARSGGIAGYANSAEISNSFSTGSISSSGGDTARSGGIVGSASVSYIIDSSSTGNISSSVISDNSMGNSNALSGGVAGYASGGEISGSSSTGNISSSVPSATMFNMAINTAASGGIVGYATNGITITRNFSTSGTGSLSSSAGSDGEAYSGGIAGYVDSGTITECYSARNISSSSSGGVWGDKAYSGGIAGYVSGSSITNCYSRGDTISSNGGSSYSAGIVGYAYNAQIYNCAATTLAIAAKTGAGRIAGYINTGNSAAISNNFALSTMISSGSAAFNTGASYHGVSKTDTQLKTQSTYSNTINGDGAGGLGWKFGTNDTNPWKMPSGGGYPILYWQ